jgi:hypothetical protein
LTNICIYIDIDNINIKDKMLQMQIYLTESQCKELFAIAQAEGKKQSQLISEAIDQLIDKAGFARREAVLRQAVGIWKGRKELPNFKKIRREYDRNETSQI